MQLDAHSDSLHAAICMQVDQFVYITDHTYTRDEVLATEEQVLDVLNFELTQPTAKTFLRRFIQVRKRQPVALESCTIAGCCSHCTVVMHSLAADLSRRQATAAPAWPTELGMCGSRCDACAASIKD